MGIFGGPRGGTTRWRLVVAQIQPAEKVGEHGKVQRTDLYAHVRQGTNTVLYNSKSAGFVAVTPDIQSAYPAIGHVTVINRCKSGCHIMNKAARLVVPGRELINNVPRSLARRASRANGSDPARHHRRMGHEKASTGRLHRAGNEDEARRDE